MPRWTLVLFSLLLIGLSILLFVKCGRSDSQTAVIQGHMLATAESIIYLQLTSIGDTVTGTGLQIRLSDAPASVAVDPLTIQGSANGSDLTLVFGYPNGTTRRLSGTVDKTLILYDPVGDGSSVSRRFEPATEGDLVRALADLVRTPSD